MVDIFSKSRIGPFFIAGPCVMESLEQTMAVAKEVARISTDLALPAVFKSSFDKANRTSLGGFRGPGLTTGLEWLKKVKQETGLSTLTDIHEAAQVESVAQEVDVLQIPAFLCRQTDLLLAAGRSGRIVNIKKGQFMAPWDMRSALDKVFSTGNRQVWLTERGNSFGYNNLVVDMRSIPIMSDLGAPVVFDATHSVQLPGGQGSCSGGERRFVPNLARAAVAAGCRGVFLETHPQPEHAFCDGPNSWPLDHLEALLRNLKALWALTGDCR